MNTTQDNDEPGLPPKVKTVAATILTEFFDNLEKEEEFHEIAPRLRKLVLTDGVFAEASVRAALFPDES